MSEPLTSEQALRRLPNLYGANLREADLREANLYGANLRGADLYKANLRGADLRWANLYGANLYGANLRGADLYGVRLHWTRWDGLAVDGLHRYRCLLTPTSDGWIVQIGCWTGTVDQLQQMIDGDDGWPESDAKQRAYHRPRLQAWIDMCHLHIAQHPDVITALAERRGSDE